MAPVWIRESPLYKELEQTYPNDEFMSNIPPAVKEFHDPCVYTNETLLPFVQMLTFWCVEADKVPLFFCHWLINVSPTQAVKQALNTFDANLSFACGKPRECLDYAIKIQHLQMIRYLITDVKVLYIFKHELYNTAITYHAKRSFEFLVKELFQNNIQTDEVTLCLSYCCQWRNPDIFQFLTGYVAENYCYGNELEKCIETNAVEVLKIIFQQNNPGFREFLLINAAHIDQDEVLEFFFQNLTSDFKRELKSAGKRILHFCLNKPTTVSQWKIAFSSPVFNFFENVEELESICRDVIDFGQYECMEFILTRGHILSEQFTAYAAKTGQLQILQLLRQHNCPWDHTCLMAAISHDQEECFMYALQNGCPWPRYFFVIGENYHK
jgi:hypothetical protein